MVAAVLLKIRGFVVVSLTFCCCGLLYILGAVVDCFGSRFGHNRAKNESGFVFLAQAVNRLCDCVYAVVGLRTMLGVRMGAWFA